MNYGLDEKIFLIFYNLPHPHFLNLLFGIISALGSYGFIWIVLAFFILRKKKKYFAKFFIGFLALYIISIFLQNSISRLRPYEIITGVKYLGLIDPGGYSFPSYHAASSFFAAAYLGKVVNKFKTHFLIFAVLISVSRIYLGAHYLTDVAVGAIIGIGLAKVVMGYGGQANRHSVALF